MSLYVQRDLEKNANRKRKKKYPEYIFPPSLKCSLKNLSVIVVSVLAKEIHQVARLGLRK